MRATCCDGSNASWVIEHVVFNGFTMFSNRASSTLSSNSSGVSMLINVFTMLFPNALLLNGIALLLNGIALALNALALNALALNALALNALALD